MVVVDEVRKIVGRILQLGEQRSMTMSGDAPLLGAVPELDSMAVVQLITALEERFDIRVSDDEIAAATFATLGTLSAFVEQKLA